MEDRKHILVVDDEENVRESLKLILSRAYDVSTAPDTSSALTVCKRTPKLDLIVVDLMMPGVDGMDLLKELRQSRPKLPVIMLTASDGVEHAVQAMKFGALDYLRKPYDVDDLLLRIEQSIASNSKPSLTHRIERSGLAEIAADFGLLVGEHSTMRQLYDQISQLAKRDTTVLIAGESGTGKELVAYEIHTRSARSSGPFVTIHCASILESMVEPELFGVDPTGSSAALERIVGQLERADGGTLFLDEIGGLSLNIQAKLLRFITHQEFFRIGSREPVRVDTRVLAATNEDLEKAVNDGRFRQDLFYRLNVVHLSAPALRERREDLARLFSHFVRRFFSLYAREITLTEQALKVLQRYSWPGNVRELENLTESLLALCPNCEISIADLPARIRTEAGGELKADVLTGEIGFQEAERVFETELILRALKKCNWVQTKAAETLGISRRILKYKMDKLGIPDEEPKKE